MDIAYVDIVTRILGCCYSSQILVNTYLHGPWRGWSKVVRVGDKNGYRIRGYCDGNFVVNIGCCYSSQILVNSYLPGQ